MASKENEHPQVAQLRQDYQSAFQGVIEKKLSAEAFLAEFPTNSADVHRETLLRFRQNLITMSERGFDAAFTNYLDQSDVASQLSSLDDAARKTASLATAQQNADGELESLSEIEPSAIFAKARMNAKTAEIARLEADVAEKENALSEAREALKSETGEYVEKRKAVLSFIENAVEVSRTLSKQSI